MNDTSRRSFLRAFGGVTVAYSALLADARAAGTSRAPKLKIFKIQALALNSSNHHYVRVYTADGLSGTGETFDTLGVAEIVNRYFGPALIGRDPLEIESIYTDLWTTLPIPLASGPTFMRGMGGPYLSAVSALEIALWDLAGKALGLPVYQLFGGKLRDKIPVYFHAHTPDAARKVIRETNCKVIKTMIDGILDEMRVEGRVTNPYGVLGRYGVVGRGPERLSYAEIDAMAGHMQSIRDVVGPSIGVAVDAHNRYDEESAIQLARTLEPMRLLWLEEPVPSDNLDALAAIRHQTKTPIACGENVYTRYGYRQLLEKEAVGVIQPDVGKTGGLGETRKIASMAEAYYVPVAAHSVLSPVGTFATAQVCATVPNLMLQEWGGYFNTHVNAIADMPAYKDGFLELGDAPGTGCNIHDDVLNEMRSPGYEKF